jgi:hypothetical protein
MSEFRLSHEAGVELDEIWILIAIESGSTEVATQIVDRITERFRTAHYVGLYDHRSTAPFVTAEFRRSSTITRF